MKFETAINIIRDYGDKVKIYCREQDILLKWSKDLCGFEGLVDLKNNKNLLVVPYQMFLYNWEVKIKEVL